MSDGEFQYNEPSGFNEITVLKTNAGFELEAYDAGIGERGCSVYVTLGDDSALALALWLIRKTEVSPSGSAPVNTGATKRD